MQLAQELKYSECDDTGEEFRQRLIRVFDTKHPYCTIDELVCRPRDAMKYADAVRSDAKCKTLSDYIILQSAMNFRKRKKWPTGMKKEITRTNFNRALADAGYPGDRDAFREFTIDCLASMYKSLSVDHITCYPRQALALCNFVRDHSGCTNLSDELILRAIQGNRKNPQ
ncbi:hypothetical protein HOV93_32780 [Planctomycetes bacterium FF15]|uniref:Uncharacterized protein n=1 Tax=Bremerella alba TaxID=980252 RepID=A0A7V8V6Y7_9BACT|nr:hypothetical protein [Bremerella alba]